MSTTSTFTEFQSFNSDVVGKVRLLSGPQTAGQPCEVYLAVTASILTERDILDQLKSFIGYEKLASVKFNHDRSNPAQLTLIMHEEITDAEEAQSVAISSVQRLIKLKERQHKYIPAIAVNSMTDRWDHT